MRLAIAADARGAALAGLDGSFDWGQAVTAAPGALPEHDVSIELGHGSPGLAADATWAPGPAGPAEGRAGGAARTIATSGDGLWSRAPWPARDELFDLRAPAEPRVLVAGGDGERRAAIVAKLEARALPAAAVDLLDLDALAAASAVALLGDDGDEAVPAEAPAVLAARRILIVPRRTVTFGLLAGTDHLAFGTEDDVVQYADAALTFPRSFDVFRTLGAVTAEHHRASTVYGRLAADLAAARD